MPFFTETAKGFYKDFAKQYLKALQLKIYST